MNILKLSIQYHRHPKYIGDRLTIAPSHIRVFYGGKFVVDVPVFKYGRED